VLFEGHCKRRGRDEPDRDFERAGRLYNPLVSTRLGLTTQARQRGSVCVAFRGELIAPAVPTPTAAPRRLLRPRARGLMRRELHERFMPDPIETRKN
jgi:hypothetical protein